MATMIRSTAYFAATLDRINVKRAQRLAASYGQVFYIKEDHERKCELADVYLYNVKQIHDHRFVSHGWDESCHSQEYKVE